MAEPTTRERRHARTRDEILAAALEIINEKGPDGLSLREIARRVDYSPAGLYEYFGSKDEIIAAVCAEGDRRLRAALKSVPHALPPSEYLVELALAYVRYAREHKEHFTLTSTRLVPESPVPYDEVEPGETYQILLDAVQAAIDAGIIRTGEGYGIDEVAYSLWALGHGVASLQVSMPDAERIIFERFIQGLGGALKD
ncbi:MAG: TetR/AcrR family transcriptional regulator [Anaerolineales bacterium]